MCIDVNIVVRHIRTVVYKIVPEWRIDDVQVLYNDIRRVAHSKRNGTFEGCGRAACSTSIFICRVGIPPDLAIAIEGATAIEIDIVAGEEPD